MAHEANTHNASRDEYTQRRTIKEETPDTHEEANRRSRRRQAIDTETKAQFAVRWNFALHMTQAPQHPAFRAPRASSPPPIPPPTLYSSLPSHLRRIGLYLSIPPSYNQSSKPHTPAGRQAAGGPWPGPAAAQRSCRRAPPSAGRRRAPGTAVPPPRLTKREASQRSLRQVAHDGWRGVGCYACLLSFIRITC